MNKKLLAVSVVFGAFISEGLVSPVFAQAGGNQAFEEIIVTGRKREESLQEVPVAISVVSDELIGEAGIFDAQDLFDSAVGFEYDTGWGDRNTATPGVRGVQGNGLGVTQQKMNSFLDGFPLVGQQGSLGFVDVQRVELYRGPQSAAFGRATFAGAINYVSRDPSEELEANVTIGTSNMGRDEFSVALAGPITDTLGFTMDISSEEYEGPDEWISTDGYHLASTSTDYFSTKLVWDPTDTFSAKLRYINQKADDRPGNRTFIDPVAFENCTNYTTPAGRDYFRGNVTERCDLSIPDGGITRNHDVPASAGLVPGDLNYELALSASVLNPYARDERERFQLELDFAVGESSIQILAMDASEYTEVWQDGDYTAAAPTFSGGPNVNGGATTLSNVVSHMSNPYNIEEQYLEVRWVSPSEERMRYMIGATNYKADVPGQGSWETAGERLGLDGPSIIGREFGPRSIYGDGITNTGIFASLSYDLSDDTTIQIEGRYQKDKISNTNAIEDNKVLEKETKSFSPRLSITHNLENGLTVYGQFSQGTNPAGVNIGYTFDGVAEAIALANAAGEVTYGPNTFKTYEEEKLTNMEVGVKGIAFDNKLNFAASLYSLEWENQTNIYTVSWDGDWNDPLLNGGIDYGFGPGDLGQRTTLNEGTITNTGVEFEGTYHIDNNWSLNGNLSLMDIQYKSFCDVLIAGGNFRLPTDGTAPGTGVDCVVQDANTPPNVPESSYNIGFAYRTGLGDSNWNLAARMDLRHAGEQWMDSANIMKVGARDLVNGSVTLSNESWVVRLWANNLTDDLTPRYVSLGSDWNQGPSGPRNLIITPQKPREIGLSVGYTF